ncbi:MULTISPECIES: hypothetical protein [unclassified Rathayibacter]|uniref:hypothetical protein n=1 Tax=unclassified Rathayibacter TaxID=2609250 RepID=UPI00188AA168|nr:MULTISPECIES: hypothetical protein [unclassified Rathayibacter]MBF4462876.1 hypothetical protein [Rathayibacter sp. VKM Ac-2879]MBF4504290.1 hypothetical protein [Rathayibacter sp. VKM Ac-2878]
MTGSGAPVALLAMSVAVLEVPFRVVFGSGVTEDDAARIMTSWESCRIEPTEGSREVVVEVGERQPTPVSQGTRITSSSVQQLEETLTSTLTVEAIGVRRSELLMLHACGIADDDGRVLAFVAASGTGKTTISRALGTRFGYVTDETVAVLPDGRVLPYPKPLSVKPLTGTAPKAQLAPASLSLRPLPEAPLVLAGVILLERREGVETPRFEPVDPIAAVEDLVPQTSYLSARPRPITDLVERLIALGGVRRLVYSEAKAVLDLVEKAFAAPQEAAPALWEAVEPLPTGARADVPDGLIVRSPTDDALLMPGGEILLFLENRLVRLSGIGPSIWRLSGEGIARAELTQALLAEVGAPPAGVDADAVVGDALDELDELGVLSRITSTTPAPKGWHA